MGGTGRSWSQGRLVDGQGAWTDKAPPYDLEGFMEQYHYHVENDYMIDND